MTRGEWGVICSWVTAVWPARSWEDTTIEAYFLELEGFTAWDVFTGLQRLSKVPESDFPPSLGDIHAAAAAALRGRISRLEEQAVTDALAEADATGGRIQVKPLDVVPPAGMPETLKRFVESIEKQMNRRRQPRLASTTQEATHG